MSTLFWLEHKEYLRSLVSSDKQQYFSYIDNLVKELNSLPITNHFYFYIINSFFSTCKLSDIDIAMIPKSEITKEIQKELNTFFKHIMPSVTVADKKIFDIQVWDMSQQLFNECYDFKKPIVFGTPVFKKYTGEHMYVWPGVTQLAENLFCRQSSIFTNKHYERQQQGVAYASPVSLFEVDSFNINNYKDDSSRLLLFNRIIKTTNFPTNCIFCDRINKSYNKEMENLLAANHGSCTSCQTNAVRMKYLSMFVKLFKQD